MVRLTLQYRHAAKRLQIILISLMKITNGSWCEEISSSGIRCLPKQLATPGLSQTKSIHYFKTTVTHYSVGNKVRQIIKELGGTMPEDLPTPEKSISKVEREQIAELKRKAKKKPLMLHELA